MPEYRLYHFRAGHIRAVTAFVEVGDNAAAAKAAEKIDGSETAELWRGAVRLKTFNPPSD